MISAGGNPNGVLSAAIALLTCFLAGAGADVRGVRDADGAPADAAATPAPHRTDAADAAPPSEAQARLAELEAHDPVAAIDAGAALSSILSQCGIA